MSRSELALAAAKLAGAKAKEPQAELNAAANLRVKNANAALLDAETEAKDTEAPRPMLHWQTAEASRTAFIMIMMLQMAGVMDNATGTDTTTSKL
jgi:hypothetical protein